MVDGDIEIEGYVVGALDGKIVISCVGKEEGMAFVGTVDGCDDIEGNSEGASEAKVRMNRFSSCVFE